MGNPFGEFSSRKAVSLLNMYLMAIHGNGEWVSGYHNGQLFLNHNLIKERGKDLRAMRDESARFLTRMSGVTNAWTIDDVLDRRATERPDAMRRNTLVNTAGDVFVSIAPGWHETDDDSLLDSPQTTLRAAASVAPAFILSPVAAACHHHHPGGCTGTRSDSDRNPAHTCSQRRRPSRAASVTVLPGCLILHHHNKNKKIQLPELYTYNVTPINSGQTLWE